MSPENWVSSMAIFYVALPIFMFVTFQNKLGLHVAGIILIADGITSFIKYLSRGTSAPFLKRPRGAEGCNIQMTGYQGGAPGFPSGHMATTTAFWSSVYFLVPVGYRIHVGILGGAFSALMMWARMKKSCHTFLQCIAGAFVGFGIAYIGFKVTNIFAV